MATKSSETQNPTGEWRARRTPETPDVVREEYRRVLKDTSLARIREDDVAMEDLTTIKRVLKRSGARPREAQSAGFVCVET